MPITMSWDGVTMGRPLAGESTLLVESISTRASAWASAERRKVHSHLVPVEIGIERLTYQRVYLDGLTLDQDRLEGLDTEPVEGRRPVEQHRVLLDHLLEHIPDLGRCRSTIRLAT